MQHISAEQLQERLIKEKDLFLVDVREEYEHEACNIGGMLIPLAEVVKKAAEIPRDKPVVVYCHHGIRSQIAIQKLQDKFDFTNLINLEGGIARWRF